SESSGIPRRTPRTASSAPWFRERPRSAVDPAGFGSHRAGAVLTHAHPGNRLGLGSLPAGPEDQDLSGDVLQHPGDVVGGEAIAVRGAGGDDAIESLVLQQ